MARRSAGLLLYRRTAAGLEVLLGHPGGPLWARRDGGAWSIPKGELEPGEDAYAAALREFAEELGFAPPVAVEPDLDLGTVRQRGGKDVLAWARRGDAEVTAIVSNTFELEWPPRSGRFGQYPELDRAAWFPIAAARTAINPAQAELLDRLEAALDADPTGRARQM